MLTPSYSYYDVNLKNDVHYSGCPISDEQIEYLVLDSTFADVANEFMPAIAKPLCEAFGVDYLCSLLPVIAFSPLTDYVIAEDFEGDKPRIKFTKD